MVTPFPKTMTEDLTYTPDPERLPEHALIANLNDAFRQTMHPMMGQVLITQGVAGLDPVAQRQLLLLVQSFDQFSEDNDPHKEHDFGAFDFDGTRYFWKVDLYDRATKSVYTPDPTNPNLTWRVLTIMEAREY
mgnify:CR=1 FL=1